MVDYYPGGEMTLHNSSTSKKTRKVDISSSGSGRRLQDVNEVMDRLNRVGGEREVGSKVQRKVEEHFSLYMLV